MSAGTPISFNPFQLPNVSDSCLPEGPQILQAGNMVFGTGAEQFLVDGNSQIFRKISALRSAYVDTTGMTAGQVRLIFNNQLLQMDFFSNGQKFVPVYVPVPFQITILSPLGDARGTVKINLYNFRILPMTVF